MDTKWSPLMIEVILHFYYSPSPFWRPSDMSLRAIRQYEGAGMLAQMDACETTGMPIYKVTEKGQAFVKMLLNTPVPIEQTYYVDPRTGEPLNK